jgi:hypothetical protein
MRLTFTKQELQEALGYNSERALDDALRRLAELGFPPRLPGMGCRWSRMAVMQWINKPACGAPGASAAAGVITGQDAGMVSDVPASTIISVRKYLEQRNGRAANDE